MNKLISLVCLYLLGILSSCTLSANEPVAEVLKSFPVTKPIVIDTTYYVDYVCDIKAINNVEIRSKVRGYLDKIHVDEGQYVKKGQLLFTIGDQEYREELLKARANLKSAIADAKAAELDLQNASTLLENNIISKTQVEMAQSKLEALNAKVDFARSLETTANINLSFTDIRAPFDGVIDRFPYKVGSLIDEGMLMTTLSDNKEVFTYFNVSENEYLDFLAQEEKSSNIDIVTLVLSNNEEHPLKGKIETIAGEFDNITGSIAFRARFSNPDKVLKHGSSGKIRLEKKLEKVVVIPQKSTFEIQDKIFVYALDENNIIRMQSIVPSMRIPHLYVIESGLDTNSRFVYEGIQELSVGLEIQPITLALDTVIVTFSKIN